MPTTVAKDQYRRLKGDLLEQVKLRKKLEERNKIEFFGIVDKDLALRHATCCKIGKGPNPVQAKLLHAWEDLTYKVFTLTGANRIGKTTILVIIAFSVMFGYWPWNNKKIVFPHTRPRKIRYIGQDWEEHIKTVVQPCLDHWWPADRPVDKKKNNQGIDATWTDKKTGSELIVMSNKQDPGTHEGWEGDVILYDEPPKREIRIANSRGLMDRQGRELLGATLLKEAWIHREIIKALDKHGNPDASVFNVNAEIDVNIGFGLTQEGVDDFARKLKPDEIEARLRGKPAYLSGLIFPKFNRQTHIKERFHNGIPLDWITDIAIDWHPSKGWAIQFVATDTINRKWVFDEIFEKNNYKYIAEEIVRRSKHLRVENIIMDPLAKSGSQADLIEETVFDKLSNLLFQYGYTLTTASKDQNSGIDLINEFLMTESEEPALFVFRDCPITIQHLEDWMWKEGKPAAEGEDMCENLYRIMLLNTQWFSHTARYTSKAKKTTWKTV
jgi:hypothetical protein